MTTKEKNLHIALIILSKESEDKKNRLKAIVFILF